jgi:hypothetical protein
MGCEVDLSPRTSADVNNECSYTGTPIVCLRDVDKANFTSFLLDKDCHSTYIQHSPEC